MNNKFFTLLIFLPLFLLGFMNVGWGQTTLTGWDMSGQSNYGTSPLTPSTTVSNITVGSLTKGSGLATGGTASAKAWGAGTSTTWSVESANAITNNTFFTFTIKANSGYTVSLNAINPFDYRRSTNGPTYGLIQYQIGSGNFTDIATVNFSSSSSSGASIGSTDLSNIAALQNLPSTSTVTIRVVLYGVSTSGTWYIFDKANTSANDFAITGTVTTAGNTAPSVTTTSATSIGVTSATFTGNITSDGGAAITERGFCYKTSSGVTITDNQTPESGTSTGTYSKLLSSLSAATHYYYKAYATNSVGTTLSATEINFWTFSNEPSAYSSTFSNSVISQTEIDLSFDAASTISNCTGYLVLKKSGSAPTGLPADGNAYTAGNTIGDATVAAIVSSNSATTSNITGLTAGTTYYFTLIPFNKGTNDATYNYKTDGTIPTTNGKTLPSNDVNSFVEAPATQVDPGTISSLVTTVEQSVEVFKFKISDAGGDGLQTKVTQITINAGSNNTADWTKTIQAVKLSADGGTTYITAGTPTINASSIVFPITSGNLNIDNNTSTTISLFIYLKSTGLTDNQVLQFNVPTASHGFIADVSGSTFLTTFANAVTSNKITISVVATKLIFSQQPSNTVINVNMIPAVTVNGCDANGNTDLDFNGDVNITSTGTLSASPQTATAVSGIATFNTINHTATGTGLTLTASHIGFSDVTSNTFDINIQAAGILLLEENFDYTAGDKLTSHGWSAHSGAGTNAISVTNPGLIYNGYASTGIGNSAIVNNNGEDVNRTFTEQGSGSTTYAAFLINVTSATTGGDYVIHLGPSLISTEFRCRLFIKKDANILRFGISSYGSTTTNYSTKDYSFGTTYLVVLKHYYDGVSQTSSLFINPSLNSESIPDLTESSTSNLPTNIGSFVLRQSSTSNIFYIDGIRVGTGWGAVLGNPQYNSDNIIATGNYNNVSVLSNNLSLNGNVTVRGALNFTGGKVTLGDNNLTMNSTAGITGYNSSNYIVTDKTGKLTINNIGNSEVTFPIGTATSYNPLYITNSGTADDFSANVKEGFTNAPPDPDKAINREWNISEATTGGSDVKLRFQFNASDVGSQFVLNDAYSVGHYEGTLWVGKEATLTGTDYPYTIDVSGITSFSPYAVGNQGAMPVSLKSLTSNVAGRNINLKWVTSEEINNAGFDVERKQATGEYVKVGFVKGSGTVTSAKSYEFTDRNLMSGKYSYRLKQIDNNGNFEYFNLSSDAVVGVPSKFDLSQNYPNPFNPATKINFDLPKDSKISLKLYDMLGREVSTLVNEFRTAGYYTVDFNASSLSSGIYFYRLLAGEFSSVKKMVILK
jgi:hypothetical protein